MAAGGGDRGRGDVRGLLRAPEIVVGTWRAARTKAADGITEEQARIVQLLVERIDVGRDGFDLRLRVDELAALAQDLSGSATDTRKAA